MMQIKLPKKYNIPIIAGVLLILVIAYEIYMGYSYIYRQLDPQADFGDASGIIRINRTGFSDASEYLNRLYKFEAPEPELVDNNPFKY